MRFLSVFQEGECVFCFVYLFFSQTLIFCLFFKKGMRFLFAWTIDRVRWIGGGGESMLIFFSLYWNLLYDVCFIKTSFWHAQTRVRPQEFCMWFEQTKKTCSFSFFFKIDAFFTCFSRGWSEFVIFEPVFFHKYDIFVCFSRRGVSFLFCLPVFLTNIDFLFVFQEGVRFLFSRTIDRVRWIGEKEEEKSQC